MKFTFRPVGERQPLDLSRTTGKLTWHKVWAYRQEGWSMQAIADAAGVSKQRIGQVSKRIEHFGAPR